MRGAMSPPSSGCLTASRHRPRVTCDTRFAIPDAMRRAAVLGVGMLLVAAGCGDESPPAAASPSPTVVATPAATAERAPSTAALRRLERRHDARLGVYALDTGT